MFGAFRLLLAIVIMVEHFEFFSYHMGATALVGFYVLSGYVTAHAFEKNFSSSGRGGLMKFYRDRLLRIYPSYILAVVIITVFFRVAMPFWTTITPVKFVLNILMLPLNFYMFIDKEYLVMVAGNLPVPYAKSLALIVEFYILAPLIMIFFKRRLWMVALPSVLVFAIASAGVIHSYYYGYILLPGTLYLFIIGVLLYLIRSGQDVTRNTWTLVGMLALLGIVAVYLYINDGFSRRHPLEVLVGVFTMTPLVYGLSFLRRDYNADVIMGTLSYPVFMLQWFASWLVTYAYMNYRLPQLDNKVLHSTASVVVCIVVSAVIFLPFESMVQGMRRRLKKRASEVKGE